MNYYSTNGHKLTKPRTKDSLQRAMTKHYLGQPLSVVLKIMGEMEKRQTLEEQEAQRLLVQYEKQTFKDIKLFDREMKDRPYYISPKEGYKPPHFDDLIPILENFAIQIEKEGLSKEYKEPKKRKALIQLSHGYGTKESIIQIPEEDI